MRGESELVADCSDALGGRDEVHGIRSSAVATKFTASAAGVLRDVLSVALDRVEVVDALAARSAEATMLTRVWRACAQRARRGLLRRARRSRRSSRHPLLGGRDAAFHMLRYHGVLAAHSSVRAEIVPGREPPSSPAQLPLFEASEVPLAPPPPPSRHPWAWLLRRVLAVEVSICPVPCCGGRMRVVDIATTPDELERVLGGKPTRARAPPPPSVSPAQLRLVFA